MNANATTSKPSTPRKSAAKRQPLPQILPIKAISALFALSGFAIAIIAGLAAGNSASRTLFIAIIALLVCHIVGVIAGAILERTVREHLDTAYAIPGQSPSLAAANASASVGSSVGPAQGSSSGQPASIGRNT